MAGFISTNFYLKKIKAINTDCIINPAEMVMICSMFLLTAAWANKQARPAQLNSTRSTVGILSLSPVSTANRVGIVAEWMKITANQPNISELAGVTWVKNHCLSRLVMIDPWVDKRCVVRFWLLCLCSILGSHSQHDNTRRLLVQADGNLPAKPFELLHNFLAIWQDL